MERVLLVQDFAHAKKFSRTVVFKDKFIKDRSELFIVTYFDIKITFDVNQADNFSKCQKVTFYE